MASGVHVDRIGRRCKAMAKPKIAPSSDDPPAAYIPDRIASEAAGRPSEEYRNAAAQIVVESVAVAEPSPWDDASKVVAWVFRSSLGCEAS